jgi:carbonic anhydrase
MEVSMNELVKVSDTKDIFPQYRGTPIEELLNFHNLGYPIKKYSNAELVIGMCMDHRKQINIPKNFAYIIRSGGGNLRYSEFKVSYAIGIGGVKAIALIGHNNCGMVNLISKRDKFIKGLVENAGWDMERAAEHFTHFVPMFEIDNEIDFVLNEAKRIQAKYPKVLVAPLLYNIEDDLLYLINES